jgi:hypothetical protein
VTPNGSWPAVHLEGTYWGGNGGSLTIHHNTILTPKADADTPGGAATHPVTAAVYAYGPDTGQAIQHLIVSDNLLAGGAYTVYGGGSTSLDTEVTGNRFSTVDWPSYGEYGVTAYNPSGSAFVWSGNVDDDSGAAVPS